jgi:hypothetical protein
MGIFVALIMRCFVVFLHLLVCFCIVAISISFAAFITVDHCRLLAVVIYPGKVAFLHCVERVVVTSRSFLPLTCSPRLSRWR